jgi:tripartite ATP-independent transporter DctM subunit
MLEYLPLLMFASLLLFIASGFPVCFVLPGTAILFGVIGHFAGSFHLSDFGFVPLRIYGIIENFTLVAVPLFVFMGFALEKSGIAHDLLKTMGYLLRRQKGSLAISVVVVGALLSASTGIVGATVVTLGVLTLPTMLAGGYPKDLATGTVAASGTLGQIIPPSIVLVLLGDMMNVDVGDLFVSAIIPGAILVFTYLLYVIWRVGRKGSDFSLTESPELSIREIALNLLPPFLLMALVLGSILLGVASPTEAAACGASGALIIALLKGKMTRVGLMSVASQTAQVTSMVFFILIGAQFFGIVFRGLSGEDLIVSMMAVAVSDFPTLILLLIMVILFVLGFFLDFLEICFIAIPILMPIINGLGFDPLWIAILIAVNLQTSFLTPPFGFALFYLKGVAPPGILTSDIYRGIIPYVIIQLLVLGLLMAFPIIILWLPGKVFG